MSTDPDADNALLDREADPPAGESFAAWHARKRAAEVRRLAKRAEEAALPKREDDESP